ncbi:propionaldehyde dehydrogenase [Rhodobacter aestuarii]|uniref:Propionaldehyde dehydrogenase n=1 Tax=Rhodobacter aestuarii TaxID=453582 RepID=A0A1N7PZR0_9RHOB|nr:aldehyde dehydrogenase family protein [Rhodobacter aestuarii]PTV93979.1 propionaldehyde dehydrogenase [Rhodobacter aestuarii]SIT16094.1 propionaldehyde dehydrogenase [Rhodobacter aestuarii]
MKDIDIENAVARVLSGYTGPAETPAPAPTSKPGTTGCVWEPVKAVDPVDDIIGGMLTRALGERNCSNCKAGDCQGKAGCLSISDAEALELGDGVFATMDEAVNAAAEAQRKYLFCTMGDRKRFVEGIRAIFTDEAVLERISRLTVEQTGMGNLAHKIIKNRLAAEKTPGVEDLTTEAQSGDDGLTLVELSPFGVIGAITPTTNPTETVICNSIGMLAAGNAAVFSPHPRAKGVSLLAIKLINRKLAALGAPANLVVTVQAPSIDNTNAMMAHPQVRMLVATGGPGIVRTVMSTGKKAIGAGAGNPPVVVDETADIPKAAQDIVNGASFDNNMPCIAEKEVIVVDQVADFLISEMQRNGAWLASDPSVVERLAQLVLTEKGGPQTGCVGKSAAWLLGQIGIQVGPDVRLIILETTKDHPFVQEELMMPILPVVRVPDVDTAIDLAVDLEHGNRHTAMMHSTNVRKLTKMAKLIQTTIFVKNGPSYAGIGVGGEGYTTFTIAGPTGEGLTSPRSFARRRKCVMVEALNVR